MVTMQRGPRFSGELYTFPNYEKYSQFDRLMRARGFEDGSSAPREKRRADLACSGEPREYPGVTVQFPEAYLYATSTRPHDPLVAELQAANYDVMDINQELSRFAQRIEMNGQHLSPKRKTTLFKRFYTDLIEPRLEDVKGRIAVLKDKAEPIELDKFERG